MNIMMKFSQNIPTPGTQPSFCGANKGEDQVKLKELHGAQNSLKHK